MQTPNEKQKVIRIDLTNDQKTPARRATGRESTAIELTVQELEERIAPGLTENHNETLLSDG